MLLQDKHWLLNTIRWVGLGTWVCNFFDSLCHSMLANILYLILKHLKESISSLFKKKPFLDTTGHIEKMYFKDSSLDPPESLFSLPSSPHHMFSVRVMSVNRYGEGRGLILCLVNHSCDDFETCSGSCFCWKLPMITCCFITQSPAYFHRKCHYLRVHDAVAQSILQHISHWAWVVFLHLGPFFPLMSHLPKSKDSSTIYPASSNSHR